MNTPLFNLIIAICAVTITLAILLKNSPVSRRIRRRRQRQEGLLENFEVMYHELARVQEVQEQLENQRERLVQLQKDMDIVHDAVITVLEYHRPLFPKK